MRRLLRLRRRLAAPGLQVTVAIIGVFAGALILGRLAVGLALVGVSLLIAADGLLRDPEHTSRENVHPLSSHEELLERYRRAR